MTQSLLPEKIRDQGFKTTDLTQQTGWEYGLGTQNFSQELLVLGMLLRAL